ncbi:MAG: TSUP family transporter [Alphaproteobacteria bacterium]|nr:TSUP family transporter [Alphaproteobacteria bacterium]
MEIFLSVVIVFATSLVEATFGFGGGLVAVPLLSLMFGIKDSVTLFLVFQALKGVLLPFIWRHIDWKGIGVIAVVFPAASALGLFLLNTVDDSLLNFVLAGYLVFYVAAGARLKFPQLRGVKNVAAQAAAGAAGGVVSGISGMGGPFIVTYLKTLSLNKETFRASVLLILFAGNALRCALSGTAGMYHGEILTLLLICLPAHLLGLAVGYKVPRLISEDRFRAAINILLVAAAISLLAKGL